MYKLIFQPVCYEESKIELSDPDPIALCGKFLTEFSDKFSGEAPAVGITRTMVATELLRAMLACIQHVDEDGFWCHSHRDDDDSDNDYHLTVTYEEQNV
jgi:hypothetical protein